MKRLFLAILLVIALLILPTRKVQAFWSIALVSETIASTHIPIGEWQIFSSWEPNETYEEGDVVFWEGQYWVRNGDGLGSNLEPSYNPPGRNFWEPLEN